MIKTLKDPIFCLFVILSKPCFILISSLFVKFGKNAKDFSENFYWEKIVKNYLNLIN